MALTGEQKKIAIDAYYRTVSEGKHLDVFAAVEAVLADQGADLNAKYVQGFEDCRAQAMNVVDEHDGFLQRIEFLKPTVLADQARAAEQGQACKHVHPLRQNSTGNGVEYHCADCGVLIEQEPDCLCCGHSYSDHLGTVPVGSDATPCIRCSCVEYHKNPQPAQPAAGDVVERVMSRGCPISCSNDLGHSYTCLREHVTAALAVAREGYVSLEHALDSLSKDEIAEIEHIFGDCSKQQIDYLISSRRARLAKPVAQTDEQKVETILRRDWSNNGITYPQLAAEIVAALRDGKEGK